MVCDLTASLISMTIIVTFTIVVAIAFFIVDNDNDDFVICFLDCLV